MIRNPGQDIRDRPGAGSPEGHIPAAAEHIVTAAGHRASAVDYKLGSAGDNPAENSQAAVGCIAAAAAHRALAVGCKREVVSNLAGHNLAGHNPAAPGEPELAAE